jgi:hypothetical protein
MRALGGTPKTQRKGSDVSVSFQRRIDSGADLVHDRVRDVDGAGVDVADPSSDG